MSRISTSSTGGNVNIQDTNGNPITSTGGSLDVNVTGNVESGTTINVFSEIDNVAIGATATVLTYTVPTGQTFTLTRIDCSGDSIATIEVEINNAVSAKKRLCYLEFNTLFEFSNQQIPALTTITVVSTNNSVQGPASFNANLQGIINT